MFVKDELVFDPSDPAFLEDPYPVLNGVRESAAVFYDEALGRWFARASATSGSAATSGT